MQAGKIYLGAHLTNGARFLVNASWQRRSKCLNSWHPNSMKPKLIFGLALVLSGGWFGCSTAEHHSQWVKVDDIKITFASPLLAPRRDVPPPEAFYPAGEAGREYGSFTNIVAGRIARIQVTWADPNHFKSENQTREFLCGLLANPKTQTWKYHVWSFGDDVPSLVADIKDAAGKTGKWIIWSYPSNYWAYQDGAGQWWWGDTEN